jgi:hypothetical protein
MEFRMSDVPFADPRVAGAMIRGLGRCGQALDEALLEVKEIMPDADWALLKRGVGQILGSDMFDMWKEIVKAHPQFEHGPSGQ